MEDFNNENSEKEIKEAIQDKTIKSFEVRDVRMNDFIVFKFTDGTELIIRYDWIYDWELLPKE